MWNTHRGVANAMVAGIVPWVRYVVLTDRLMAELTPDEIEAVFGHEIGHVKHHHMTYYLGFLAVSVLLVGAFSKWLWSYLFNQANESPFEAFPMIAMLGSYIFVVFGFLSRRCERQADVYGCRAVSCVRPDCPRARGRKRPGAVRPGALPDGHPHVYRGAGEGGPAQRHQPRQAGLAGVVAALHDRAASRLPAGCAPGPRRGTPVPAARDRW